jgi:transposase
MRPPAPLTSLSGDVADDGPEDGSTELCDGFSLDAAVRTSHPIRRLAVAVDFDFIRGPVPQLLQATRPAVRGSGGLLFKSRLLGYLFNITSERRLCEEASLNLAWRVDREGHIN